MGDDLFAPGELEDILEHEQEDHTGNEPVEVPTDPSALDLFSADIYQLYQ